MGHAELVSEIIGALKGAGFPLVGTCRGAVGPECAGAFSSWLRGGLHGPLDYMARTAGLRADPRAFLPWARGAFCVAIPYNTSRELSAARVRDGKAWVSRYAWGRDYHKVMRARLRPAARLLEERGHLARVCVDSAPVPERALAARAGLGFVGKSGCLVHPAYGSYLFLGEVFTDLELEDGDPVRDGCGECALCLRACPVKAFVAPRVLDAGRCISTWTIEHRGAFPPVPPALHGHLFGCDRCQEACPFNRDAPLSPEAEFRPREGWFVPDPSRIATMTEAEWDAATRGSAVRRAGYGGLLRNARRILEEEDSPQRHRGTEENR